MAPRGFGGPQGPPLRLLGHTLSQTFLNAAWSERWKESYAELTAEHQASCDRAAIALIKRESPPGLRIKPIQPEKYYLEARISSGDRIVFRVEAETIYFVDVVKHDDIERYSRRPGKRSR